MELDKQNVFEDKNSPAMVECVGASANSSKQWKQLGEDERKVSVQEEMKRMHQLPANSSYVTHRFRVLNKILQLISIKVGVAL
ncbi:Serine/threonine-protein kinase ATM [Bienertia sinuspersici]